MIPLNRRPDSRDLRIFGLALGMVLTALGLLALWRHSILRIPITGDWTKRVVLAMLIAAAASFLVALTRPQTLRPAYLGLTAVTAPIGFVISHLILAIMFYGVFTPIGWCFRLFGRDLLQRQFEPTATTYWERRTEASSLRRYFRQY